jgi:hypothetical protein
MISPSEYFSPANFSRYQYAMTFADKLKDYHKNGFWIYDGYSISKDWEPVIKTEFPNGVEVWSVVGYRVGHCTISIVDIEWDDKPHIPSKKRINEAFKSLHVIDPKTIKRFK